MARCRSYLRGLSICVTVLLMASGVVMIGVGFSSIDGNIPVAEMDSEVDEVFLNVTPLHRAERYIQTELNKLQNSVTDKTWVHSKPCGPILKSYLSFPIKLRIGIISAFATIAMAAIALCLALGLEKYWKKPPVESTVDDFNRVKYEPKPSLT
ncbi:hypothetical protein E3U43_020566 [Larimichthys crocea]|uniref:Uncharacterized protein n=1 Tax=Larimichthys crocea TaxID=215358 RepID=A0ACD3Q5W0_LARCR|nr:hypothetical protein E3U43_020566 [Larimichthys crocea]